MVECIGSHRTAHCDEELNQVFWGTRIINKAGADLQSVPPAQRISPTSLLYTPAGADLQSEPPAQQISPTSLFYAASNDCTYLLLK